MTSQDDKCIECENEMLLRCSDLEIELDKCKRYISMLEKANDIAQALNQTLRDEAQNLRYKMELYKEKAEMLSLEKE